ISNLENNRTREKENAKKSAYKFEIQLSEHHREMPSLENSIVKELTNICGIARYKITSLPEKKKIIVRLNQYKLRKNGYNNTNRGAIGVYGTSWAFIMKKFGHNSGPLSRRIQVSFKDKARSELEHIIKNKLPLG
ncbi:10491_t:CDS:2, partial [Scutellospora calospora]